VAFYLAKYNTGTTISFPMIKRAVVDFAVTGDWTPATGDTKVSKDQAAFANSTNNPAAVSGTGSAGWSLALTATELSCAELSIQIVDSATKAVEDQWLTVYTYGNASAKFPVDFSDVVRLGLTALPNAAAEAAGGLYTRGSGAGQINQPANGRIDTNVIAVGGTTQTARDLGASVLLSAGTGTGQLDFTSGVVKASLVQILGTALTETAGQIAAAFKQFFDVASPTGTMKAITNVVTTTTATNVTNDVGITQAGADKVWSTATRALTDKANFTLSAAGIQAVWDALTSALTTVGSIGKLLVDNINATISSRMATYTQPTGFLAATFPTGTIANTTNITAGTVTTATNVTTVNDKTGYALTSGERDAVADALLDRANAIETGLTPRGSLRLISAAEAGKLSGAATTTVTIRNAVIDSKARITATVDASGNRTAITTDVA
jgi:hypothetical protein